MSLCNSRIYVTRCMKSILARLLIWAPTAYSVAVSRKSLHQCTNKVILVNSVKIKTRSAAVAVIYSLSKGYDPWYPWSGQGGDYYDVKGEPRGRWWGRAAPELGLEPGGAVDREAYRRVIAERVDPRDGQTRLGRSPQKATARADARYQELLAAEPHATQGRRFELRQQAARDTRQGPLYYDLTAEFSKSSSVFYASIAENARSAPEGGDDEEAAVMASLVAEIDEMLYEANQVGLDYFEREAGYTRSGQGRGRHRPARVEQVRLGGHEQVELLKAPPGREHSPDRRVRPGQADTRQPALRLQAGQRR
jgi:hypothetical protein